MFIIFPIFVLYWDELQYCSVGSLIVTILVTKQTLYITEDLLLDVTIHVFSVSNFLKFPDQGVGIVAFSESDVDELTLL